MEQLFPTLENSHPSKQLNKALAPSQHTLQNSDTTNTNVRRNQFKSENEV
jgi:hypothetical protein